FGPRAYAQFLGDQKTAPPVVLGVSPDERERMRIVLKESADAEQSARRLRGGLILPIGVGLGVLGGVIIANSGSPAIRDAGQQIPAAATGALLVGGGVVLSTVSTINILRPSRPERSYDNFVKSLTLAPDTQQAQAQYAEAEHQLLSAAESDRI